MTEKEIDELAGNLSPIIDRMKEINYEIRRTKKYDEARELLDTVTCIWGECSRAKTKLLKLKEIYAK